MKTTAEMIKVMQAYEDGKPIEVMERGDPTETWNKMIIGNPSWNWFIYDYRIKPPKMIKKQGWMNCYPCSDRNSIWKTKDEADFAASSIRIACVPLEWEEPEQ